jgi:hypothetical protein
MDVPPLNVVPFKMVNDDAVAIAKDLLAKCESGQIVTFAAVGVDRSDGTFMWLGGGNKTRLQVLGAICNLLLHYWSGDIRDDL